MFNISLAYYGNIAQENMTFPLWMFLDKITDRE